MGNRRKRANWFFRLGAMPTALRGHDLALSGSHGHAKPWPWHPQVNLLTHLMSTRLILQDFLKYRKARLAAKVPLIELQQVRRVGRNLSRQALRVAILQPNGGMVH